MKKKNLLQNSKSAKNKKFPYPKKITPFFIITAIIFSTALGMRCYIRTSAYFNVASVQPLDFAEELDLTGKNIFKIDLKAIAQRISENHPELKSLQVLRMLPNRILIKSKKRIAIAQIESRGKAQLKYWTVDAESIILPWVLDYADFTLPVIKNIDIDIKTLNYGEKYDSPKLNEAIILIKKIRKIGSLNNRIVSTVEVMDNNTLSFTVEMQSLNKLKPHYVEIRVLQEDSDNKLRLLPQLLSELEKKEMEPEYIDLRFEDVIVGP